MAQSQPYLGGYVLLCGWYKRVMHKCKQQDNYKINSNVNTT